MNQLIPTMVLILALALPAQALSTDGHLIPDGVPRPAAVEAASLTMDEAVALAMRNHPQLRAADATARAAGQRVGQAAAGYWPTLGVGGSFSHSESERSGVAVGSGGATSTVFVPTSSTSVNDSSQVQITVQQTLLDFGKQGMEVEQAEAGHRAALEDLERTRQDLVLAVRQAFHAAAIDQQVLEIRRQTVANRQGRLEQARAMYEEGVRAKSEVTKAESDLAQARLEEIRAQTQVDLDWVGLNVAMGLPRDSRYDLILDPERETVPDLSSERLYDLALQERPEMAALAARLQGQVARLEAVYRDRLPTVNATGSMGWAGQPSPLDPAWSVGLSFNWNLFNGNLSRYQAGEARATAESLSAQAEQQAQQIYQEVQTHLVSLRQAEAQQEAAAAALAAAEENWRLASERYKVGVGNSLEVSDAELALTQARLDVASADHARREARARLERAVGVDDLTEAVAGGDSR